MAVQKYTSSKQQEKVKKNILSPEDRSLWEAFTSTVQPLFTPSKNENIVSERDHLWKAQSKQRRSNFQIKSEKSLYSLQRKEFNCLKNQKKPPSLQQKQIDPTTYRHIAKGRVRIEAQIDLHGLTQSRAYDTLHRFLFNAQMQDLRYILVITGKGRSLDSPGILRHAVQDWFTTPLFRALVYAYKNAANHHGGDGALYVHLRRR